MIETKILFLTHNNNHIEQQLMKLHAPCEIRSRQMIEQFLLSFVTTVPAILFPKFDFWDEQKLQISFITEQSLQFIEPKIQDYYQNTGIEIYTIKNINNEYYQLTNLVDSSILKMDADKKELNKLFSKVIPQWKDLLTHDFGGNVKSIPDKTIKLFVFKYINDILNLLRDQYC